MRKIFTLLLLSACVWQTIAGNALTDEEKLHTTAKLWGFLKYYHPVVAKGKFDWDNQLFTIIEKTKTAHSKAALSKVYSDWIDGLGTVIICKNCAKPSKGPLFEKNFDLSWTQDQKLFTSDLSAKLKFIEANRHQGKSHYFDVEPGIKNVKIQNETMDKNANWNNENIRLLARFRYWNQVEYFFPYKYMTDQKWDDVLKEMIPKFIHCQNEVEFHLAMLELAIKLDDTHANLYTPILRNHFGANWVPAGYEFIEGKAIITTLYDLTTSQKDTLQINDIIEKINGISVDDIVAKNYKYLNGSNKSAKWRNTNSLLLSGQTDSVTLSINRNGISIDKVVKRFGLDRFKKVNPTTKLSWEIKPDNIGYVDMRRLTVKETPSTMQNLANTKAIIFDLRNYPNGTFVALAKQLYSEPKSFAKFIAPDPDYPGKFYWIPEKTKDSKNNNAYKGKIIILVNEQTQSQAEFTAMMMQAVSGSITIGSQTAGADGDVSLLTFPNGSTSYMTGLGVFYPDGTETQRKGIKVDIEVKPTILGIQEGRDEVLQKALEVISKIK